MRKEFLDKLICPFDKSELSIRIINQQNEDIHEGYLTCQLCKRYYPIVSGIPIMTPDEYREASLEVPLLKKWGEQLLVTNDSPTPFRLMPASDKKIL